MSYTRPLDSDLPFCKNSISQGAIDLFDLSVGDSYSVLPVSSKTGEVVWFRHTDPICGFIRPPRGCGNSCNRGFALFMKERKKAMQSPFKEKELYYTFTISPKSGTCTGEKLLDNFLRKFTLKKNIYSPYVNYFCIEHFNGSNPHIHCAFKSDRQVQLTHLPTFMYNARKMEKVADSTFLGGGMRLQFNTSATENHRKTGKSNHNVTVKYIMKPEADKKIYSLCGGKSKLIQEIE